MRRIFFLHTLPFCGVLLLAARAYAADATVSRPGDDALIRARLWQIEQDAGITSANGLAYVGGAAIPSRDKFALLRFVEDTRQRVERILGVPLSHSRYGVSVHGVADEATEGSAIQSATVRVRSRFPISIRVVNPADLDPSALASRLCSAWLQAYALAKVPADVLRARMSEPGYAAWSTPFPTWFGAGLGALADVQAKQADADLVFARWSAGGLPPVETLLGAYAPETAAHPELAAQLVAWILDAGAPKAQGAAHIGAFFPIH